jgi:DNA-binding PadR family transcriptional regulator
MLAILAGESRQAQAIKAELSRHYDERIDPKTFYASLEALEDAGFVRAETDGIHDVYALTEAGEARLREHYTWLGEQLATG